jgi:hypothetical protein
MRRSIETYDDLRVFVHGERGKMVVLKRHRYDRSTIWLGPIAAGAAGTIGKRSFA